MLKKFFDRLPLPATLLPTTLLALMPVAATVAQEQKLYEVELIVFERLRPGGNSEDETWPKNLSLDYPALWKVLIDPALAEAQQESENLKGETSWALSDEVLQKLGGSTGETAPAQYDTGGLSDPSLAAEPGSESSLESEQSDSTALNGTPYYEYLAKESLELQDARYHLNRDPNLRILFHNRWQQPLKAEANAPALILHGGNQFGEHHELEGYIKVHLGKYIHVDTDLWLTQFVANYGQASDHWPQLPDLPSKNDALYQRLSDSLGGLSATPRESDAGGGYRFGDYSSPDSSQATGGSVYTQAQSSWQDTAEEPDPYQSLLQSPYLINQIVTLRQSRRMRSSELHYVDHPRMGLLVKISPVESKPDASETQPAPGNSG